MDVTLCIICVWYMIAHWSSFPFSFTFIIAVPCK